MSAQAQPLAQALEPWAHAIAQVTSPRFWPNDTSTDGWGGYGLGQAGAGFKFIDGWLQRIDGVKYQAGPNGLTYIELTDIKIDRFTDSVVSDLAKNDPEVRRSEFTIELVDGWTWAHDVRRDHTHTTSLASAKAEAWKASAEVQLGYTTGSEGGVGGSVKAATEYGQTLTDTASTTDSVTDSVHSSLDGKGPGKWKVSVLSEIQDRTQTVSVDALMDFGILMHTDLDRLPPTAHPAHWSSWQDVLLPGLRGLAPADTSGSPFQGSTPIFDAVKAHPLTAAEEALIAGPVRGLVTYQAPYQAVEIIEVTVKPA